MGDDLGNRGCPPERVREDPPGSNYAGDGTPDSTAGNRLSGRTLHRERATQARWAALFAAHCAGTGAAIRAGNMA